jgi:NADPH:quinone reductase
MIAIEVQQTGGPEVLVPVVRPMPDLRADEVLIRQEAVGVNFVDFQHCAGTPYPPLALPFVPGIEAAGVVSGVGSDVRDFAMGDRVAYCGPMPGAYADYAAIRADLVVPVPPDFTSLRAATALMQGMTAHYLAHDAHPVESGEWVLVHAAGSGVGRMIVQYALQKGANVIGTSRSAARREEIVALGAMYALSPDQPNFPETVREVSAGCHVVYDSLGGDHFLNALKCLRSRGELVSYGLAAGPVPAFDVARLAGYYDTDIAGSLRISRTSLGDFVPDATALRRRAASVFSDLKRGVLTVDAPRVFSLTEARAAHEAAASGDGSKLVLVPGGVDQPSRVR